jgi:PKHD-type hydroxylase
MNIKPIFNLNESIDQTNYYLFDTAFNKEELDWIYNLVERYPFEKATTIGNNSEDVDVIRKSNIKWIHHDNLSYWVYDKIQNMVLEANQLWDFNIHSVVDSIQYTEYLEGGGHYDWHVDIGPGTINHRKISITIQLSDSNEYEGGDFEIWSGGQFKKLPKKKGCAILFPSFLMHRVTPITKGVRKSLVLWVGGESYK